MHPCICKTFLVILTHQVILIIFVVVVVNNEDFIERVNYS